MTNKQRAFLSSLANKEDSILRIGKGSITPEYIGAIEEAIAKRELIKISVLKNCMDDPHEIADVIAERKIILYRPAKKPVIKLPEK